MLRDSFLIHRIHVKGFLLFLLRCGCKNGVGVGVYFSNARRTPFAINRTSCLNIVNDVRSVKSLIHTCENPGGADKLRRE